MSLPASAKSSAAALTAIGTDTALELVGTPTLPDTLRAVRVHGTVCFTGMLSNQWTVRDFYPIDYHVYQFGQIAEAHAAMEASQATGKLVVLT